jgi:hypothetical protein
VRYLLRGLLVCQKCGYCFTGHNPRPWRYYRCSGTDRSKFHGQLRCDARLLAVEPLEAAVWDWPAPMEWSGHNFSGAWWPMAVPSRSGLGGGTASLLPAQPPPARAGGSRAHYEAGQY